MPKATPDNPLPKASPLMLSIKGVADALDMSERTIRKLKNDGRIPKPLQVGGSVRWSFEELQEWIRAGCPRRA